MASEFLSNLLFLVEYQWKYLFGFAGGVDVQERK